MTLAGHPVALGFTIMSKALTLRRYDGSKFFKINWPESAGPRREKCVFNSGVPICFWLLSRSVKLLGVIQLKGVTTNNGS